MKDFKSTIALFLIFTFFCTLFALPQGVLAASEPFTDFTITLGDTSYKANINPIRKTISIDAVALNTGARAIAHAKIDYTGGTIAEIPSGSRVDMTAPVLCTINNERWTISAELSTSPLAAEFQNFTAAPQVAANFSGWEADIRRNAIGPETSYLTGQSNKGIWANIGYLFDASGIIRSDASYGELTIDSAGGTINLKKNRTGGYFGTYSTEGDNSPASSNKIVTEFKMKINSLEDTGTALTVRSGCTDYFTITGKDAPQDKYYIGWKSASHDTNNVYTEKAFDFGTWYTFRMIFRKYPETATGYVVEIYADNDFICETAGWIQSGGGVIKPEGSLKHSGAPRAWDKTQFCLVGDKFSEFDLDLDYVYVSANTGSEVAKNDSNITYNCEPFGPVLDVDVQTPSLSAYDGAVDWGFEENGEGWIIKEHNLISNPGFSDNSVWYKSTSGFDQADVTYEDGLKPGDRYAKMTYNAAPVGNERVGSWRDNTIYNINPNSTYAMSVDTITENMDTLSYTEMSFKTSSSNTSFDYNKVTNEGSGLCSVAGNMGSQLGWHRAYDEYIPSNNNEKYITQIAFRINKGQLGTTAYFDNMYFGTIERIEQKGDIYKLPVRHSDVNSGKGMLKLGAYNSLYGDDAVESVKIDIDEYKTYNVSAYAKSVSGSVGAMVKVSYLDSSDNIVFSDASPAVTADTWTKTAKDFTAPYGADKMIISLVASGSGVVCFDDVAYTEVASEPTDFYGLADRNMQIPASGDKSYTFTSYVTDQFLSKMPQLGITYSLKQPITGISISGNVLTVSSSVSDNTTAVIVAETPGLRKEYTYTFKNMQLIINGSDTILRQSSDVTTSYSAYLNSNGVLSGPLTASQVTWTVTGADTKVSVDANGTVTVKPDALIGNYILKATYKDDDSVTLKKTIQVTRILESASLPGTSGGVSNNKNTGGTGGYDSVVQTPAPAPLKSPIAFMDVLNDHWAYTDIMEFYDSGFVNGKSGGIFDPDGDVTRGEYVKLIVSSLGITAQNISLEFSDISSDMWEYEYILAAVSADIINGFEDGSFRPDEKISRMDMAVIGYRAAKYLKMGLWYERDVDFADISSVPEYALKPITILAEAGIINGTSEYAFDPYATSTRAQAVAICQRIRTQLN